MTRYILYLALALLTISCGNEGGRKKRGKQNTTVAATANEKKGMEQVTAFYGGECNYSAGTTSAGKKYFKVDVSKSSVLDSSVDITALNSSNIALIFYDNLLTESGNYEEIHVGITLTDGQHIDNVYPVGQLNLVLDKNKIVMRIVEKLKIKAYDDLDSLLNDENGIVKYDKKSLIEKIKKADPAIGKIQEYIPYGFVFFKTDDQKEILRIAGMILRDKQNNQFSVDIDPKSIKEEAIFINYKF